MFDFFELIVNSTDKNNYKKSDRKLFLFIVTFLLFFILIIARKNLFNVENFSQLIVSVALISSMLGILSILGLFKANIVSQMRIIEFVFLFLSLFLMFSIILLETNHYFKIIT